VGQSAHRPHSLPELTNFLGRLPESHIDRDCVVEAAVCCEPVSPPNSLITGKIADLWADTKE